jgi:hypothetical protein
VEKIEREKGKYLVNEQGFALAKSLAWQVSHSFFISAIDMVMTRTRKIYIQAPIGVTIMANGTWRQGYRV